MGEMLTVKELSELLKVSRATLSNWRKKGLPYLKGVGGVRFDKEEVLKWLKDKK